MAQKSLRAQSLSSQARNPVVGQVVGDLLPDRVYNLTPNRMGGYTPFGRRAAVNDADDFQIELENMPRLIGFDETGISSYKTAAEQLQLYRGRTKAYRYSPRTDANDAALVHLDAAGAYVSRDDYLVFDQAHPDRDYRIPAEPIAASVSANVNAGAPFESGLTGVAGAHDVAFGDGAFIIAAANLFRRTGADNTTWEMVEAAPISPAGSVYYRVKHANGLWMALARSSGTHTVAYSSTGLAGAWTTVALPSGFISLGLSYLGGGNWAIYGNSILVSTDGGATWVERDDLWGHNWRVYDGDYSAFTGTTLAPAAMDVSNPSGNAQHTMVTTDGGPTWWTMREKSMDVWPFDMPTQVRSGALRVFAFSDGSYLYVHRNGWTSTATPVNDLVGMYFYHRMAPGGTIVAGGMNDVIIYDAAYDPGSDLVVAVGRPSGSVSAPAVWHSQDRGQTWERVSDVESGFDPSREIEAVAFDDGGNILYLNGAAEYVYTANPAGLRTGAYNIYVVQYFNTHAGRFVFGMSHTAVAVESDGATLSFTATGKATILAQNPWMTVNPAYSPIVDDLRFDVYIQRGSDVIEGEEVRYTIRYAFTEPFPEGSGEVALDRSISALPLGTTLLTDGIPTTAVFEKSVTAIHNGRVWGLANQDEGLWPVAEDGISPEIANQAQRFILSYSEIGWANLMSDRSFIPLQPTQSSRFTGMTSTPSGLLVMFENEIFLITGDPAYGNVGVELYLDMVGNDIGSHPCKVGGVPFVIWNGKVWVLQAGQAQQLAPDQWRREDPFVQVSPEPQTRSILALTESGQVFRYVLDDQFWLTDPVTRDEPGIVQMLPNCVCVTGDNTRFVSESDDSYPVWSTRQDGTPDVPHIYYRGIDFGEPDKRHALYLMKFGCENYTRPRRNDPDFDALEVPVVYWESASDDNTSTEGLSDADTPEPMPPVGGCLPYSLPRGNAVGGSFAWRFPLQRTRSSGIDVRIELRGMEYTDVFRLPIELFYSSSGTIR